MKQVSFIGLGSMGQAMVRRLLESGYRVTVWNRSPEAVDVLVAEGADRAGSVAEAFEVGPVLSMLANDAAVEAVFDPETLAAVGSSGLHVNLATVSLACARELTVRHRTAGVRYLAAPVLGRPPVAASGQLNILAAGDQAVIEENAELLGVLGKRTWNFGPEPWQANVVKIAMNYTLVHAIQALSEAIPLAERHGVDPEKLVELMSESFFPGPVYSGYGREIATSDYLPAAFTTVLGLKDVNLAGAAADAVDLELSALPALVAVFEAALERGYGDHDWASIAEVVRGRSAGPLR